MQPQNSEKEIWITGYNLGIASQSEFCFYFTTLIFIFFLELQRGKNMNCEMKKYKLASGFHNKMHAFKTL